MAIEVGTYYIVPFGEQCQLREITAIDRNLATYNIWSSRLGGCGTNRADIVLLASLFEFPISEDKAECLIHLWTNQ